MSESIEKAVVEALEALGESYELMDCDPDFADTAQFCERYQIPPEKSANTIIVASKKEPKKYAACIVTASCRLDVNHALRRQLGVRKVSFASADQTRELTGMLIGGVTPFSLPEGMPIYVDSRVMELDWMILGGGSRSKKIKLSPRVFERMSEVKVIEGLAKSID